ncbi:MAG: NAD-glutamate dehydrogenase [Francisellaceae bacterium]
MHQDKQTTEILEKLKKRFQQNFEEKDAQVLEELSRFYFNVVSTEEIASRDIIDLYGMIVSLWRFILKRKKDELKVRVYNPDFEQHGWSSRHTVIEIVTNDSPFIVDTLMMLMSSLNLGMHFIMNIGGLLIKRDGQHQLVSITKEATHCNEDECFVIMEVDRQKSSVEVLEAIEEKIRYTYKLLTMVTSDFQPMKQVLNRIISEIQQPINQQSVNEFDEVLDFLEFLQKDHFIFLGYCELDVNGEVPNLQLKPIKGTQLGLMRQDSGYELPLTGYHIHARELARSEGKTPMLVVAKSDQLSPIHRPAYMDIIGVSIRNEKGDVVSHKCLLGLYTSAAYHSSPKHIPFLRLRRQMVLERSGFRANGYSYKAVCNIIDTYPRDELFLSSDDELFNTVMGIFHLRERQVTRLFTRKDTFSRYYFCMLYMPRERYNSNLREKIERLLLKTFNGARIDFKTNFLESVLCRIDFTVYMDNNEVIDVDYERLDADLHAIERQWSDDLLSLLIAERGENQGRLYFDEYGHGFSAAYKDDFMPRTAVNDIRHFEETKQMPVAMSLYQLLEESGNRFHMKLYLCNDVIQLSTVMPILENMGMCIIQERPYKLTNKSGDYIWLSDFGISLFEECKLDKLYDLIKEGFLKVWLGIAENDRFNSLIIRAGLNWREVALIRAYSRYLMQIGIRFSQSYIEDTFIEYSNVVQAIVALFKVKFDIDSKLSEREQKLKVLESEIVEGLSNVASLDQDKILRSMLELVHATVRTNYFQKDEEGQHKPYIAFKIKPRSITEMPKPVPKHEIFMHSPRVEGVHLRFADVARGGLRWSDRKEDYRTEVLGLVKAQQVKNAVIVPLGAKGGFVPKRLPVESGGDAVIAEAIACYKLFIAALLDVTDNIKNNEVIKPVDVICYDDDDPYLVVAADKGTATFSDIANEMALEYGFWMGDAFASGGSNGYDHKKMGITAKGAWESVKRHFRERGKDIQNEDFTVVGIGDMGGDVFGNGMLLSRHIRLVAAFNHMHIFIDPDPNAEISYEERLRLFNLPRSSWEDYDLKLISKGGGIFSRKAKSIALTPQMRKLLSTSKERLEPNELISLLLKAEVELLWNGGIGTYVKSMTESNESVGDRANDALRVNGTDLGCRVVGEGGNLGFTQLGRIEYALKGGAINTDAIDNSAGVDCSDHEVNIKILLNMAVEKGKLTQQARNRLLAEMEDEVSTLVLANNYDQNKTISSALQSKQAYTVEAYVRLMRELERKMQLDREIEFLPSDKTLYTRSLSGGNITSPEFSVIMAYTKTMIKQQILRSSLPEDPYFTPYLQAEFPQILAKRYASEMHHHKLAQDIIATQLTNSICKHMGITFIQRLYDETGASIADIIRAYCAVVEIFMIDQIWQEIDALDGVISAESQQHMIAMISRFVRRNCRWILKNKGKSFDIADIVAKYRKPVLTALEIIPGLLIASEKRRIDEKAKLFVKAGVPQALLDRVMALRIATSVMDLSVSLTKVKNQQMFEAVAILLNQNLWLSWFRGTINSLGKKQSYWGTLSTSALRDDLDGVQYHLVHSVIEHCQDSSTSVTDMVKCWMDENSSYVSRWLGLIDDIKSDEPNFESVNVAFRGLKDLLTR